MNCRRISPLSWNTLGKKKRCLHLWIWCLWHRQVLACTFYKESSFVHFIYTCSYSLSTILKALAQCCNNFAKMRSAGDFFGPPYCCQEKFWEYWGSGRILPQAENIFVCRVWCSTKNSTQQQQQQQNSRSAWQLWWMEKWKLIRLFLIFDMTWRN